MITKKLEKMRATDEKPEPSSKIAGFMGNLAKVNGSIGLLLDEWADIYLLNTVYYMSQERKGNIHY